MIHHAWRAVTGSPVPHVHVVFHSTVSAALKQPGSSLVWPWRSRPENGGSRVGYPRLVHHLPVRRIQRTKTLLRTIIMITYESTQVSTDYLPQLFISTVVNCDNQYHESDYCIQRPHTDMCAPTTQVHIVTTIM